MADRKFVSKAEERRYNALKAADRKYNALKKEETGIVSRSDCMSEQEVKDLLWKTFKEWMTGQTCPIKDEQLMYYRWDVERFVQSASRAFIDD